MKWIFATILFFPLVCSADWFGPKNYEDCIIQGMQGTTSNLAAQEIKKACRTKFPAAPMQQAKSKTMSGHAANQALNNLRLSHAPNYFGRSDTDHKVEFHNPLNQWVTSITIAVKINDAEPIFYRASANAKPLLMVLLILGLAFQRNPKLHRGGFMSLKSLTNN